MTVGRLGSILATAGVILVTYGCDELEESLDCVDICRQIHGCVDSKLDEDRCETSCHSKIDQDVALRDRATDCRDCMAYRTCAQVSSDCSDCANVAASFSH